MTDGPAWTIRRAGARDAPVVHDLVHAAYAKWVDVLGQPPKPMRADYDRAVAEHAVDLLIVERDVVALIETTPVADALLVVNVAVSPTVQRRGYGRALLDHAERTADALGLRMMRLNTNKLMEPNIALYARLGYAIEREEEIAGFGTVVHMCKPL